MPRIRTTVVGSYPIPDWLVASPSEQALMDATRVVIGTQEQAGVDVVCDGELYRFDINHPETNGMIEYFVRPMDGITQRFSFDDLIAYRSSSGMKFRTRPPGTVIGPIGHGSLDLPLACARAKALATRTFKFTVTGPHMLAKTLIDRHYKDTAELAHAIADALAAQVKHLDADVVQIDEANLPGHPEEWEWAASAMNRVLDAVPGTPAVHLCFGNYGGQTVQSFLAAGLIDDLTITVVPVLLGSGRPLFGPLAGDIALPDVARNPRPGLLQVVGRHQTIAAVVTRPDQHDDPLAFQAHPSLNRLHRGPAGVLHHLRETQAALVGYTLQGAALFHRNHFHVSHQSAPSPLARAESAGARNSVPSHSQVTSAAAKPATVSAMSKKKS